MAQFKISVYVDLPGVEQKKLGSLVRKIAKVSEDAKDSAVYVERVRSDGSTTDITHTLDSKT